MAVGGSWRHLALHFVQLEAFWTFWRWSSVSVSVRIRWEHPTGNTRNHRSCGNSSHWHRQNQQTEVKLFMWNRLRWVEGVKWWVTGRQVLTPAQWFLISRPGWEPSVQLVPGTKTVEPSGVVPCALSRLCSFRCVCGGHGGQQHWEVVHRPAGGWRWNSGGERREGVQSQSGPGDAPSDQQHPCHGARAPTLEAVSVVTLGQVQPEDMGSDTMGEHWKKVSQRDEAHSHCTGVHLG